MSDRRPDVFEPEAVEPCPTCDDVGMVAWNESPIGDPQAWQDAPCPTCSAYLYGSTRQPRDAA